MSKEITNKDLRLSDVPQRLVIWNERIQEFALTFNGYEFHGGFDECKAIAEKRSPTTLTDYRTCLFFEQRRWRHYGSDPEGEDLRYLRWLLSGIRERVRNGEV